MANESANHNKEAMETVFYMRFVPRAYKGTLEQSVSLVSFVSEWATAGRELTTKLEAGSWRPVRENGKPEDEGHPPMEAITKQRDWEQWSVCRSDSWGVVTSCISIQ
jgi:hypothetical protein